MTKINGVYKMHKYFQYHSNLDSFRIFSMEHLFTMGIIFFLCILLYIFKDVFGKNHNKEFFRWSLAVLLFVGESWYHLWLVYEKSWSVKQDLPLQLSDIAVLLCIIMLVTRNNKLFQFMYFAGLASSVQAILTPDLGKFSFPHFQYIEFFVSHGGVVLSCIFMAVVLKYRPTFRYMWITILILNLYALFVYLLNKLLGANYLYIMKKPAASSLLNYLGPWPWYLISMEIVTIVSFFILYAPFWVKNHD